MVTNFAHDYYALYRNLDGELFQDDTFVGQLAVPSFVPLGWYERLQEWYPYDREVLEGLVTATEALGLDEPPGRARWQLTVLDWPCSPTVSD